MKKFMKHILVVVIFIFLIGITLFIIFNQKSIIKVEEKGEQLSTRENNFITTADHLSQTVEKDKQIEELTSSNTNNAAQIAALNSKITNLNAQISSLAPQYTYNFTIRSGSVNQEIGVAYIPCRGYRTLKITATSYIQESTIYTWTQSIYGVKNGTSTALLTRNNKTNNGVSLSYTFDISNYDFFRIESSSAHSSYWTGSYTLIP